MFVKNALEKQYPGDQSEKAYENLKLDLKIDPPKHLLLKRFFIIIFIRSPIHPFLLHQFLLQTAKYLASSENLKKTYQL